jgi:tryptophan-rich sensory protein
MKPENVQSGSSDARIDLGAVQQAIGLVVAIVICFAAAGLGGLVTTPQIPNWYADLAKPNWTPPGWIFGPVWSCLYLMMAVAAWLVWRQHGFAGAKLPLTLFAIQLALNSLWSVLFFGLQNPGAAAVEIILLWVAILATLIAFWKRSRWAGGLLLPYLAWVSFAAVLNVAIWRMNVG